jgi:hypothetical protein
VRELSQRLQQTIAEFQRQYPMAQDEVWEAVQLAAEASGLEPTVKWSLRRTALLLLVLLGLPFLITAIIRALRS